MNAVTFGGARVSATAVFKRGPAKPRKSFFVRLMDALAESRMREAHREIEKHAHLLAPDDPRRERAAR